MALALPPILGVNGRSRGMKDACMGLDLVDFGVGSPWPHGICPPFFFFPNRSNLRLRALLGVSEEVTMSTPFLAKLPELALVMLMEAAAAAAMAAGAAVAAEEGEEAAGAAW